MIYDKDVTPRKAYLLDLCKKMKNRVERKRRSLKIIKAELKNAKTIKSCMEKLTPLLTKQSVEIVRTQISQGARHPKGHRFTLQLKLIALTLWRCGPRNYGVLQTMFTFPSVDRLQALLKNFELLPGLNIKLFSLLMLQTKTMNPRDIYINLIWDETRVERNLSYDSARDYIFGYDDLGQGQRGKGIASEVLIFFITSISATKSRFKYPIAFYLTSSAVKGEKLKCLISFWLHMLTLIGLKPVLTTCDQNSTNINALQALGATQQSPFINILNRRVVCTFDPPHILKCIRNLLLKNDLYFKNNSNCVKFEYYCKLYEEDSKLDPRRCPKLTKDHLNPKGKVKMRVSKATQLMSNHTADGMLSLVDAKVLPREALDTVKFTRSMDQMLDSFNGRPGDEQLGKHWYF